MANTILRKEVWGVQKFPMLVTDLNYVFQLVHLVKNVYKERQQFLNIKLPRVPEKAGGAPSKHLDNWDPIFQGFFSRAKESFLNSPQAKYQHSFNRNSLVPKVVGLKASTVPAGTA